ncbi:MAG: histidine kinase dimerization/phospho-acceptor domain-containing protein, partial [Rectinemataceae bacterium]|nr:histidine kinase dimerization/phospho-acceptor domain-containing protein [Rectinemataceae bacterium]
MAAVNNDFLAGFANSIRGKNQGNLAMFYGQTARPLFSELEHEKELAWLQGKIQSDKILSLSPDVVTFTEKEMNGGFRIFSLQYLPQFNVYLALAIDSKDVFSTWYQDRFNDMLFIIVLTLFTLLATFFAFILTRQVKKIQESEKTAVLASQAKSEFLASMSHELRTPLNAIIGFSEMLEAGYFGPINAKQKERIQDIASCGTHLLELINDILEFSKADAGKLELREKRCEIGKIVEDCLRIFRERSRIDGKELISNISPQLPVFMADERKLKQILLNLLSNSVKFTQKGGKIEVSAFLDVEKNMLLSVKDNGTGIAPEDIPKALSVFGQAHSQSKFGGTGLGLPLSKMLAEL